MLKARWNARENAPNTEVPASTRILAVASGKGGVGKSLGHRQPRRGDRRGRVHRRRARRRHLGLLRAPPARHRRPARGRAVEGSRQADDHPNARCRSATAMLEGRQHRLPRRGGHRADVARSDAHQGGRAVPARRALGRARLPVHRHAAGHRRRADGPGPDAAAHRSADRHHSGDRCPEGGGHGPPTWPGAASCGCAA